MALQNNPVVDRDHPNLCEEKQGGGGIADRVTVCCPPPAQPTWGILYQQGWPLRVMDLSMMSSTTRKKPCN